MHSDDTKVQTQKIFRIILQAMSRPGRVYVMDMVGEVGLMLVLQTFIDNEVTFTVVGDGHENLKQNIVEATRSMAVNIQDADFVIIPSGNSEGEVLKAKRGSLGYPHLGATVVYLVDNFDDEKTGNTKCLMKGPGIDHEISACINGLNKDELIHLREMNTDYPLGVDSLFLDKTGRILCIPRSSSMEVR